MSNPAGARYEPWEARLERKLNKLTDAVRTLLDAVNRPAFPFQKEVARFSLADMLLNEVQFGSAAPPIVPGPGEQRPPHPTGCWCEPCFEKTKHVKECRCNDCFDNHAHVVGCQCDSCRDCRDRRPRPR